jgi:hypothetical protein
VFPRKFILFPDLVKIFLSYKGPHLNLNAFHSSAQKMKCSGCKKAIEDNNYLATMDQQWHTGCNKEI